MHATLLEPSETRLRLTCLTHLQEQLGKLEASQSSSAEAREQAIAEAERAAAMARKHAAAQKAAKAKTWSEEEVRMLEKALVKFPQVEFPSSGEQYG